MKDGSRGKYFHCWKVRYEWRYRSGDTRKDVTDHFINELVITAEDSIDDVRDRISDNLPDKTFLYELIEARWLGHAQVDEETFLRAKGGEG